MSDPKPAKREWLVRPRPDDPALSVEVEGIDHDGKPSASRVIVEKPLTLFLNRREVVTMMTIGDHPQLLAVGYLANQNMLKAGDRIDAVEHDADLGVVVVRTPVETDFETKLAKRVRTSGCAQGTVFGDVIDAFARIRLPKAARLKTSWLHSLTRKINTEPSLYLAAGAVHGCVLCEEDRPLVYMEDVGRHNAVDKVAGWMFMNREPAANKIFYTTGRLTSEMVIKTAMMGVPVLVSRSGFTAWGVELARQVGLTLIGRARGNRFLALSGAERIVFDADAQSGPDEETRHRRKGASGDD
jgi:FdhD protein